MTGSWYLSGLWPPFAAAVQYLESFLQPYGYELRLVSGYRSNQEQLQLYRQGRTSAEVASHTKKFGRGGAVTDAPPGYSAHNYGLAIDLDTDYSGHAVVMAVAKAMGFGSVSWDPAHLEWPSWRALVGV